MLSQLTRVLGSQVGLALIGLATLPVTARNLGVNQYADFSLFLVLVATISLLDFVRPLLISGQTSTEKRLPSYTHQIVLINGLLVVGAALAVGWLLLSVVATASLILSVLAYVLASPAYAQAALAGKVGFLHVTRNGAWALAYLVVMSLSFVSESAIAYSLPFACANVMVIGIYLRMVGVFPVAKAASAGETRPRLPLRNISELVSFSFVTGALPVVDRGLVRRLFEEASVGRYMAHSDLAMRTNMIGTALGQTIYPYFSNRVQSAGVEVARHYFLRCLFWALLGQGALIATLMLISDPLLAFFFGAEFELAPQLYSLFLVGVWLQILGFLITPWQRARGDFGTSRSAYVLGLVAMTVTASVCIPWLGLIGGALAYLTARLADVTMFAHEVRELPERRDRYIAVLCFLAALACLSLLALRSSGFW